MTASAKNSRFRKRTMGAEAENGLAALNKKIAEIKKKIQLSEGQRKAYYEENENAIRQNAEKINNLKKELSKLTEELSKAKSELGGDCHFRLVKYLHELGPIKNKDHDQLKQILDLKVIDLHKQLDLITYKRKKKKAQLNRLEQEYQKLLSEKSKINGDKKTTKTSKKAISQLENDIHRIAVQWMEAEHVRKKYTGIRYSLLNDSVKFESALAEAELMIERQNEEIKKLQDVNRSAMLMRDSTVSALLQHESEAADASGQREKRLVHFRNKVEDRKGELERLERKIFPTARPTLIQQDSVGSGELAPVEEENGSSMGGFHMDDVFNKLMKATGVSDPENVFDRFKAQQATTERLFYLKNNMEEEKKHLESDQNLMLAELEAHKFAQVKDKEENIEEMENLKLEIDKETEKQKILAAEEKKILDMLLDIKRSFYDCCLKLEDADDVIVPDWSEDTTNLDEIFRLLKGKYLAASKITEESESVKITQEYLSPKPGEDRRRSRDITPLEKSPSEERSALPAAYRELMAPRTKSRGAAGTPSGSQTKPAVSDEEEEIPSRGFLKRQAQLIVDTKSRRKGYRIPQMTKK